MSCSPPPGGRLGPPSDRYRLRRSFTSCRKTSDYFIHSATSAYAVRKPSRSRQCACLSTPKCYSIISRTAPNSLPRLKERGSWFEPAFPAIPRPVRRVGDRSGKGNFFFYARPNSHRNIYWRGLEAIDDAMRKGILAPEDWNVHFVGRGLPDMELPGGVRPIVSYGLLWSDYAKLVSTMDLGLCLQYTPHPSYPPLDLAAAGAVVVTNTHGSKASLEQWSRNIIAVPPSVPTLVEGLRQGVLLSRDTERRTASSASDRIPRDWEPELRPALERMLGKGCKNRCS